MKDNKPSVATEIARESSVTSASAPERLLPLIYGELRALGAHYLRGERPDHTLQATALVHEAYLKIANQKWVAWQDRVQFGRIAARAMRQVLIEHARANKAAKRAGKLQKVYLDETRELGVPHNPDMIELDQALADLTRLYPRKAEVVELKFFGGLEIDEIAQALKISTKTVKRDWTFARAWLCRELTQDAA